MKKAYMADKFLIRGFLALWQCAASRGLFIALPVVR
jgi:hypothetical protein